MSSTYDFPGSSGAPASTELQTALHYLGAIKVRLELLYEHSTQDHRLLEQLSDEVDWLDSEIERIRQTASAGTSEVTSQQSLTPTGD